MADIYTLETLPHGGENRAGYNYDWHTSSAKSRQPNPRAMMIVEVRDRDLTREEVIRTLRSLADSLERGELE
jgi:hypothetical protein